MLRTCAIYCSPRQLSCLSMEKQIFAVFLLVTEIDVSIRSGSSSSINNPMRAHFRNAFICKCPFPILVFAKV